MASQLKMGLHFIKFKYKTVCMHFCLLQSQQPDPKLSIEGEPVKTVKESFKTLDIIKVLAKSKWDADFTVLLHFYEVLVRSHLDYGSIVYGSAMKSYISLLDTIKGYVWP